MTYKKGFEQTFDTTCEQTKNLQTAQNSAKRGLFVASSVPISMTGPNPNRKDPTPLFNQTINILFNYYHFQIT